MIPVSIQTTIATLRRSGFLPVSLLLLSLACSRSPLLPDLRPPTATPVTIRFLQPAENPVPPHDPLIFDLHLTPAPSTPPPTATPIETPAQAVTGPPQAIPAQTFDPPDPSLPPPSPTPSLLTDTLILLDPAPGLILPAGRDTLEFKWVWQGDTGRVCRLPQDHGFEIRIWPNPDPAANPHLPHSVRRTVQPWGVADAAAMQETLAASCDPGDGTRRYTVTGLSRTPAVSLAGGQGHFYWDVAYVQLQPTYTPLGISEPRDFSIPAAGTPLADAPPAAGCPALAGTITLLEPPSGHIFPATPGPVQFRWRWQAPDQPQGQDPCSLPPGYGFELRIWSKQPGFGPLGVMDAVAAQDQITCDPAGGDTRSYTISDLTRTPGVKATYVGEYRWDGHFWWDVALVCLNPYRPPETSGPRRDFEIALSHYPGPLDPFGPPLTCPDFRSWPEAQALFLAAGGPARDPHHLDPDMNQVACDNLRQ